MAIAQEMTRAPMRMRFIRLLLRQERPGSIPAYGKPEVVGRRRARIPNRPGPGPGCMEGRMATPIGRPTVSPHLLAAILALSWPLGALSADEFDAQAALFRYDAAADLKVEEAGVEQQGTAAVHDIRLTPVPGAEPVKAYVVVPEGKGPFAGVLWVHWLGEPATTNRTEFLQEEASLAPKGGVSLLVDAMWSAPGGYAKRRPEQDYDNSIRQGIALRRAVYLPVPRPDRDKARI